MRVDKLVSVDKKPQADHELFDASDVTWEVLPSKKKNEIHIVLRSEGVFNLTKVYLALCMMVEKIGVQLNILDKAEGEH